MKTLLITSSTTLLLPVRNQIVGYVHVCAAAATSTLEVFDGTIGSVATIAIGAAGSGYAALDVLTLQQAGGTSGVQATVTVTTVDGTGAITGVTVLAAGTGYVAGTTYATTGGTGTGGTITVSTITDAGTSIAKVSCVADTNSPQVKLCDNTFAGVSVRISGSAAKGYLTYE